MRILLDTNILVFAHNTHSSYHAKAKKVVLAVLDGKIAGYVTPQKHLLGYGFMGNKITNFNHREHRVSVENTEIQLIENYKVKFFFCELIFMNSVISVVFPIFRRKQLDFLRN